MCFVSIFHIGNTHPTSYLSGGRYTTNQMNIQEFPDMLLMIDAFLNIKSWIWICWIYCSLRFVCILSRLTILSSPPFDLLRLQSRTGDPCISVAKGTEAKKMGQCVTENKQQYIFIPMTYVICIHLYVLKNHNTKIWMDQQQRGNQQPTSGI